MGAVFALASFTSAFAAESSAQSNPTPAYGHHQAAQKHRVNLEELAKKKGITVDELKAEFEAKKAEKNK